MTSTDTRKATASISRPPTQAPNEATRRTISSGMSRPGRPKAEYPSAQREGTPMNAPGALRRGQRDVQHLADRIVPVLHARRAAAFRPIVEDHRGDDLLRQRRIGRARTHQRHLAGEAVFARALAD